MCDTADEAIWFCDSIYDLVERSVTASGDDIVTPLADCFSGQGFGRAFSWRDVNQGRSEPIDLFEDQIEIFYGACFGI